ncbi:Anthranilate N-benzoyltransferase protein 3 [Rhynchospora pubera]|uniref:Anthranilate N-benzoyltransferase protein 3 n=1 Tax=Rhynchospora pubera TaxID=906938 RepID=A0AAV8BSS4_9POAL|nr:Anthranilate N-benzoyltransferase protein 3 [Rhynchospora pubera]
MVIGCVFDHRAVDAYSFFMFMSAWANIALNKPINQMPSFCRFLLSSSNSSDPIYDQIFTPLSHQPPPNPEISSETRVNHIYYISSVDIARLQELSGHSHSKVVCFIAYFWKILARTARRGEKLCSMGAVVDGRSFMKTVHGDNFMKNYFGNVLSVPLGKLQAKSLIDMTLAEVAEEVNKWLSPAKKEDHFLGLHEWVERQKPKPILPTAYLGDCNEEDESISCAVSSGRRFPEINFGWGNATFSSCHFPVGNKGGLLFPVPQSNTGDWIVYAKVAPRIVAAMEQEPTIFRPLRTLQCLHEYKSKSSRARL